MELVFASRNAHKTKEISTFLNDEFEILGLDDIGFNDEIEEPFLTLKENAFQKCSVIHNFSKKNCFADDSGLFVEALQGLPGVKSARFAGLHSNSDDNIRLLLQKMEGMENRSAYFETCICMIVEQQTYFFNGVIQGNITHEHCGTNGFGYDPIFIPENYNITFAEMPLQLKNEISHRAIALKKMRAFLNSLH